MTTPRVSSTLVASTWDMAASLLACGLAPDSSRVVLFAQSAVREHTELAWLLACNTPLGSLSRMTQFKTKNGAARDAASLGLLAYPVLQAADILLYRATHVPVGEDQHQHLELARELAAAASIAFGSKAGATAGARTPLFSAPATLSAPRGARIMSLTDGTRKMSKSDANDDSRINMDDSDDAIVAKVRAARTDSERGFSLLDRERRPEKTNLVEILSLMTGEAVEAVERRHASSEARVFKDELAAALIAVVAPIRRELERLRRDRAFVDAVLDNGARAARERARVTMEEVRLLAGYV
jgi:tryptophanyl-tRNA synthetase